MSGGLLLAAGGAWAAKLAVIAATAGRVSDTGAAAVFYLIGLVLLVVGSAAAGVYLARRLHVAVRVAAAVVAPTAVMVVVGAVDAVLRPLVPAGAAPWVAEEIGIFGAAVLALGAGAALLVAGRRQATAASAVT